MAQKGRFFSVTLIILAINVLVFFAAMALEYFYGANVTNNLALKPLDILHGERLWTLVTSMFMHANIIHLFVNMMSLMFIGGFLERIIGGKKFLFIYLLSGLVASLFFVGWAFVFNQDMTIGAVGASGAIFGLGGVLAVLTPKLPVYILFIPIAMPMWLGIVLMLAVMWLMSWVAKLPIGNTAHLGGFLTGLVYGFYLRLRYKKKVQRLDKFFR